MGRDWRVRSLLEATPEWLKIQDSEGFSSALGVAETVTVRTGEKHRSSAGTLTLFDKKGNVTWQAP